MYVLYNINNCYLIYLIIYLIHIEFININWNKSLIIYINSHNLFIFNLSLFKIGHVSNDNSLTHAQKILAQIRFSIGAFILTL